MKILSSRARQEALSKVSVQATTVSHAPTEAKRLQDPQRFIEELIHFERHGTRTKLNLTYGQKLVLESLSNHKGTIVNRARGVGMTTLELSYLLARAMTADRTTHVLVTPTITMARNLAAELRVMHQMLSHDFRAEVESYSHNDTRFTNGSRILFRAPGEYRSVRGTRCDTLIISDLSSVDQAAQKAAVGEMIVSLVPAVPADGKILISSVPGYEGDFFHTLWEQSCSMRVPFYNPIELDFRDSCLVDGWQNVGSFRMAMDAATFAREFMCEFTTR